MSTNLSYLKTTTNGFFSYRRRTPKPLRDYIDSIEVKKSLGNNEPEAITKAIRLNNLLNEAVELTKIQSIPRETIEELLSSELNLTKLKKIHNPKSLLQFTTLYLEQSEVTPVEYAYREYFFGSFFPLVVEVLFKEKDIELESLGYERLLKIRKLFLKLPNKNYSVYKTMNQKELITKVLNGSVMIPKEHQVSEDTANKNIKRVKSLLLFAKELGAYSHSIPKALTVQRKGDTSARDLKAVLTDDEIETVLNNFDEDVKYIYEVLLYTGMRRSELYKCDVTEVDGVKCFDLMSPNELLKTSSSYRLIPVHDKLLRRIDEYKDIINGLKPDRLTRGFTRVVQRLLEEPEDKTLYSLRHTFATSLIAKGVHPELVTELMGHAHSSMTMNRYVKGYPIRTLKEAIDCLN